jgi:hypothetical protein
MIHIGGRGNVNFAEAIRVFSNLVQCRAVESCHCPALNASELPKEWKTPLALKKSVFLALWRCVRVNMPISGQPRLPRPRPAVVTAGGYSTFLFRAAVLAVSYLLDSREDYWR